MIVQIWMTSLLIAALFWIPINTVDSEKMPYWAQAVVATGFIVSMTVMVITSFMRIWA